MNSAFFLEQLVKPRLSCRQHGVAALPRTDLTLLDKELGLGFGLGNDFLGTIRGTFERLDRSDLCFGSSKYLRRLLASLAENTVSFVFDNRSLFTVSGQALPNFLPSTHLRGDLAQEVPDLHDVVTAPRHTERLTIDLFRSQMHSHSFAAIHGIIRELDNPATRPVVPNEDRSAKHWALGAVLGNDRLMRVHLIDGTYELFRYYFAAPSHVASDGREVGAVRGVLGSMIQLLEQGATHIGIATDHVIESFRNDLWDDYKDGSEIEEGIRSQFQLLEDVLAGAGFTVWPMIEFEADDALGAAANNYADDPSVEEVIICTPDKDLAQCVSDVRRIVQFDRRKEVRYDEAGVREKFGVDPTSISDYLALVGDSADGFPGLPGWGAKSTSAVLSRYGKLEDIPAAAGQWDITVRSGAKLAQTLADNQELALLFRRIATIELDAPVDENVASLEWTGPMEGFTELAESIDAQRHLARIEKLLKRT